MNLTEHDPYSKSENNLTGHLGKGLRDRYKKLKLKAKFGLSLLGGTVDTPRYPPGTHGPVARPPEPDPASVPWRIAPLRSARGSGPAIPRTHMEPTNGGRVYGTDYGRSL